MRKRPASDRSVKFDDIENMTSMAMVNSEVSIQSNQPKKKFRVPDTPDPRQKHGNEFYRRSLEKKRNSIEKGNDNHCVSFNGDIDFNAESLNTSKKSHTSKTRRNVLKAVSEVNGVETSPKDISAPAKLITSRCNDVLSEASDVVFIKSRKKLKKKKKKQWKHRNVELIEEDEEEDGLSLGSQDTLDGVVDDEEMEMDDDSFIVPDDVDVAEDRSSDDEELSGTENLMDELADEMVELADEQLEHDISHQNDAMGIDQLAKSFEQFGYITMVKEPTCLAIKATLASAVSMPFEPFVFSDHEDSTVIAHKALNWMISPCDNQRFFRDFYQRSAFVVKRSAPSYYDSLFNTQQFLQLLQDNTLEYGKHINVAIYKQEKRKTKKGVGRVSPQAIQEDLQSGYSIQCVNPQSYVKGLHYLCEILQEAFSCFVGANSYITPPNSKGFAPHWDDVDAFILQLEGSKHWTVAAPIKEDYKLPLDSSGNFRDNVFNEPGRKVVFRGYLNTGDVLYIPRGFIHQAYTTDKHSMHVTISTSRHITYADMLKKQLPAMLDKLTETEFNMRVSLPPTLFNVNGVAAIDYSSEELSPKIFDDVSYKLIKQLGKTFANFGSCVVDQLALDFMRVALPPLLSPDEIKHSALASPNAKKIYTADGVIYKKNTKVRLIRRHTQRLLYDDENTAFIAHRMNNPMFYDEERLVTTINLPIELESGFITLCGAYPKWIEISALGLEMELAQRLARLLFRNCLLLIDNSAPTKTK